MKNLRLLLIVFSVLLLASAIQAQPLIVQPGFQVVPFAGIAAGGPPIQSAKFSVIDVPGGQFGGMMYVSELNGAGVVQVTPAGAVIPYTQPFGPFGSGASGVDIDAATADLPGATAGLYAGAGAMFVGEVGTGNVNQVAPGGNWGVFTATGAGPGVAGLQFDRTPGFVYNGLMYVGDWGGDATDGLLSVTAAGVVAPFALLPNVDPRYFTFDSRAGVSPYGASRLWVASFASGNVFSVTPAGVANAPLGNVGAGVEGLAFGHGDPYFGSNLYAANLALGTIDVLAPNGAVTPFGVGFGGAAYLQFVRSGPYAMGGMPTLYVDDGAGSIYAVNPIPEPATIALIAIGLGGAGLCCSRRRRNKSGMAVGQAQEHGR